MTRRRAKGEGTIYPVRNDDGKIVGYEGSIEITSGVGGKRRRKKATGKTKRDVSRKLDEYRKQAEAGMDLGAKRQTLKRFLDHWLKDVVAQRCSPKTQSSYRDEVRNHIVPHLGHITLDKLNPTPIEQMRDELEQTPQKLRPDQKLGPRQVEYAVLVLKRALNRAIKEKLITYNPAALVEVKKATPKRIFLKIEQAQRFLAVLAGHRQEALYAALILTGMRKGEALALRWPDIDLDQRTITVSKTTQRIHGHGRHTGTTKTGKERAISMPSVLVHLLQRHEIRQRGEGLYSPDGLVFPSEAGTEVESGNLHRQFKGLLEQAGLPLDATIHSLRHTCASLLLDAGENIANVSAQLGHARVSTTSDIYAHAVASSQARGIEALGQRLRRDEDE